jgi:hypothetical protein
MHRKGKTDASFESPEFFHLKFIPLVHDRPMVSQKLLRPDLKYRCSPENTLKNQFESPAVSPQYPKFSKNTINDHPKLIKAISSLDLNQGLRPSVHYSSSLYSDYQSTLKDSGFNRHKSNFYESSTGRILRNESKDLDKLRMRILRAKEKKQHLLDFLKGLKSK